MKNGDMKDTIPLFWFSHDSFYHTSHLHELSFYIDICSFIEHNWVRLEMILSRILAEFVELRQNPAQQDISRDFTFYVSLPA